MDDILDINECGTKAVKMNEFTTEEFRKRKLQLSVDKCAWIHIGRSESEKCEDIFIDKWEVRKRTKGDEIVLDDVFVGKVKVKNVTEYEYLGDLVTDDGSSTKNVKMRAAKGQGVLRDIKEILEGTYFGSFFIEALMLLRNSLLIAVLTYNLEVSFSLSARDIKLLDDVDLQLWRTSLGLSSKSARALIHSELGIISVKYILKKKRVLYFHHLLKCEEKNVLCQTLSSLGKG